MECAQQKFHEAKSKEAVSGIGMCFSWGNNNNNKWNIFLGFVNNLKLPI